MKSPNLTQILDQFPASQLHNTLLFVRRFMALQELSVIAGITRQVEVKEFVDAGLRVAQVQEAVDVLKAVCEVFNPAPGRGEGIAAVRVECPKVVEVGEVMWVRGLAFTKTSELEEELSRREREAPLNGKLAICISRMGGVFLVGDRLKKYQPTKKEFELIEFLRKNGKARLKEISKALCAEGSNIATWRKVMNQKFATTVGLKYELICHNGSEGYFLNTVDFTIVWE